VTLAVGATVLAGKEAIVSRLTAIEELAGMDILCSDKTGTITKNAISVADVKPFSGFSEEDVITAAAFASKRESIDPIDTAILSRFDSLYAGHMQRVFEPVAFVPFDPVSKFSKATVRNGTGKEIDVAKGAPQAIAALAGTTTCGPRTLDACVTEFAEKGYRSLGAAKTGDDGKWQYLGVIGLFDPPREDSAATIAAAGDLGIQVKMVTGDHSAIAKESPGKSASAPGLYPRQNSWLSMTRQRLRSWKGLTGLLRSFPNTSSTS
jgi:H+-transporting ATPase